MTRSKRDRKAALGGCVIAVSLAVGLGAFVPRPATAASLSTPKCKSGSTLDPRTGKCVADPKSSCRAGLTFDVRTRKCVAIPPAAPSKYYNCPPPNQISIQLTGPPGWSDATVLSANIFLSQAGVVNPGASGNSATSPRMLCEYKTGVSASAAGRIQHISKLLDDAPGYQCVLHPPGNAMAATGLKCDLP